MSLHLPSRLTYNNCGMHYGKTLALITVALLVGGIISQLPSALADDSDNPFSSLWDAIFDLQSRDDDLQAQIDELKAERNALLAQTGAEPVFVSDPYAEMEVETTEDGRTLIHVTVGNTGPDRAAGVKLTAFYLMPLFEINSIDGDQCEDKSRGIIECALGTLEADQESVITIDATARESGEANTWTVDISTTTDDADYTNNHVTYDFETGSGQPIEIPEVEQPEEEQEEQEESVDDSGEIEAEPERDNSGSNSTSSESEESQESSGNQTSTENESEETSGGNQTSSETVEDSGSNSTSSESEDDQRPSSDESSSEEASEEGTQEQQSGESETEEQVEEQDQEEQGTSDESAQDGSDESDSGEESSGNEESGSEDSAEGGSETGDSGESPSQ
jgi:hypothetical protein